MTDTRTGGRITVVVATYKRPQALPTLLASLKRQTLGADDFELSVVVDGIDETEPQYRDVLAAAQREMPFRVHFDFQPNAGQSVGRERAMAATSSPWLCVVDDDMDLLPEFLAAHLAALEAGGSKTVVIGRVIPEEGWQQQPLYEAVRTSHMLEWHNELARHESEPWGYTLVTQNVSFSREFFFAVGGFDDKLRLGEDSELGLRFEFAGGKFVFADDAAAIHRSRVGSYDAWLKRTVEYGRVGVYVYEKLGRDARAHPLRNLVNGSRLNAAAVHATCWSNALARTSIEALHRTGNVLQRVGLEQPAVATHKAIIALAYHLGVKDALGSWGRLLAAKREFRAAEAAPRKPT